MSLSNVLDVAVYGEANALLGQIIVARISLAEAEGAQSLKQRVRAVCRDRLSAYKVPTRVVIADSELFTSRYKKTRRAASSA